MPERAKVEKTPSFKDTLSKISSIGKVEADSTNDSVSKVENSVKKLATAFGQSDLDEQWLVFVERLRKKDIRMYSALKSIKPLVSENNSVEISFQNNSQVEEFQTRLRPALLSELRESLKNECIEIISKVAESEKLERPTLLNDKEKLENMIEKNPALLQLKNKFKLDFE